MRRAMDAEVFVENGKLYGFNLGADFVSEHEWGIDKLKRLFGVSNNKNGLFGSVKPVLGVAARTITTVPEKALHYGEITIEKKKYFFLICYNSYVREIEKITVDLIKGFELYPFRDNHIFTAWDEGSFGILVDEEYKEELSNLYDAFMNKDIVFAMGRGHVFKNSGLLLIVRSSMSEEEVQKMYDMDMDSINMKKAAEKTGIEKILKEAGKRYFALSPRWKDETKTEVIFWLNPMDQHIYNFGWFGVEELKQWANNEGPVIMKDKRG